jgi:hypothetical protein
MILRILLIFLRDKIDDQLYNKLNKLSDMLLHAWEDVNDHPFDVVKIRYYNLLLTKHREIVEYAYTSFKSHIKHNSSEDDDKSFEIFSKLIPYKRRRILNYQSKM